ncbi:MAG: alginate lyase family protein [Armatimonadota bacterium]
MMMFMLCIAVFVAWSVPGVAEEPLPPVDAEISDLEVLQAIRAGYPGLSDFDAAMQAGETDRARQLLAEHFATREKPYVPEAQHPAIHPADSTMMLKADGSSQKTADEQWLKHIYTFRNYDTGEMETYDLGDEINWMHNPSSYYGWIAKLHQMNILAKLAGIYEDIGDPKYAEEVGNLVVSWTEQAPRNISGHIRGDTIASVNIYMQVRNRTGNVIAAYDVVRSCPEFTPEMHMAFWKLFVGNCRYLVPWSYDRDVVTFPVLTSAGIYLPEFKDSDEWVEAGKANLVENLVERTTPDGAWDTFSVSYQTVCIPWALRVLEFVRANDTDGDFSEIEQIIVRQAQKMEEIMLWLVMPNGGTPCIGDMYGRTDWSSGYLADKLEWYLASYVDEDTRERLEAIADPYERIRATLAHMEDREDIPATTSLGFRSTGYYVMRESWTADRAPYMYLSLSPQGRAHAHLDALHCELYAYGKPLIVDTGDYFLGWGDRTALHNTIEVDRQMQAWRAEMIPCEWITQPGFDYFDGAHAGYTGQDVIHRRKMLFVKTDDDRFADYWLMSDLLTGSGEHEYEQFFHFAGPTQTEPATAAIDPETKTAYTENPNSPDVYVAPAPDDDLQVRFVEAQDTEMKPEDKRERKAMLGWLVTAGTFNRVKSPVAAYSKSGEPPVSFFDALLPVPEDSSADVRVSRLRVMADEDVLEPTEAAGFRIDITMDTPAYRPDEIELDPGENLAAGKDASASVNEGTIADGSAAKLTDGNLGPREIGAAVNSSPFQPKVPLEGFYEIDFGEPVQTNMVVLHHGTWNGSDIIYPPEELTIQYHAEDEWTIVPDPATMWDDTVTSRTSFERVTADRLRAVIKRPSGGRIAMREFQAYNVANEEMQRVAALRSERKTRRWTDYLLLSHKGAGMRTYGSFEFNGELAFIRKTAESETVRAIVKHGDRLFEGDRCLIARLVTRCFDAAAEDFGAIEIEQPTVPTIRDLKVSLHPAQSGIRGGQPYAFVTWTTDVPATSQVRYVGDDGIVRRTFFDAEPTTDHRVRVDFLRQGHTYRFTALSVHGGVSKAEKTITAPGPAGGSPD